MNPFTIIAGVMAGLVLGFCTVFLCRAQLPTPLWRVAAGALAGGCGGALLGSVGGDLNRRGKPEGMTRYVVGFLAGAVTGAAAAWQYDTLLGLVKDLLPTRSPL